MSTDEIIDNENELEEVEGADASNEVVPSDAHSR